jgi:hypothetical protein
MLVMMRYRFAGRGVADVATLLDFSAKFNDLDDELDITPVVELGPANAGPRLPCESVRSLGGVRGLP